MKNIRRNASTVSILSLPLILLAFVATATADGPLTQSDLLARVIDVDRLMMKPQPGDGCRLVSGVVGNGEAANKAPKADAEGWLTIFRADGRGVVSRIFFAAPSGEFRLSVDGRQIIAGTLSDLFDGKIAPIAGPITHRVQSDGAGVCYFPIGFAKGCRIDVRKANSAFEITYAALGQDVAPFSTVLDDAAREQLEHVNKTLTGGYSEKKLFANKKLMPVLGSQEIKPGDSLTESIENAGIIRAIYVNFPDRRPTLIPGLLHQVIVRVFFDGESDPSVEAPLPDFFGSGFGLQDCTGLPLGTRRWIDVPAERVNQNEFCYCYFPMPFRNGVRVEFKNMSDTKIELTYFLRVQLGEPPEEALRFHARFRGENPAKASEYLVLDTTGPGRFVGALINVDNPRYDWWGAGGAALRIDGKDELRDDDVSHYIGDTPPLHALSTALHGATRAAAAGKSSAYRWQIADSAAFQKSSRFVLTKPQSSAKSDLYVSSVAYWYAPADAKYKFRALKPEDVELPGLRLPGAIEVEGNIVGKDWGREVRQRDAMGFEYSAGAAALVESNSPVTIEIPLAKARSGHLKLRVNQLRGFEKIDVTDESGKSIGSAVYSRSQTGAVYDIGPVELKAGANRIRVTCSKPAVLDCWLVE